ncbi:hypothetical protein F5B20DRAFT_587600 [Whalleya microplaca]|nr:hypothetical protein F5B20DRAFT_587600 [Whalleya microplaca]
MSAITIRDVPKTRSGWFTSCQKVGIQDPDNTSIHNQDRRVLSSASMIGDVQFHLLRVLWPMSKDPFHRRNDNLDNIFQEECLSTSKDHLNNLYSWNKYLTWMKEPNHRKLQPPEDLGPFALVLLSQKYTSGLDRQDACDGVDFSPIASRLRDRALPPRPETPTPSRFDQAPPDERMSGMNISEDTDVPMSSPPSLPSQSSPLAGVAASQEIKIKNEQEVVICLVTFLRAVCIFAQGAENAIWKADQDRFTMKDNRGAVLFTAEVDALLRVVQTVRIIIETKKGTRYEDGNSARFKAQESCQMATWIAQDGHLNAQQLRQENLTEKRMMISQDRNEVWVIIATFDADYVDYIRGTSTKKAFLSMQEFGPYDLKDYRDVNELGVICLAASLQECQKIYP